MSEAVERLTAAVAKIRTMLDGQLGDAQALAVVCAEAGLYDDKYTFYGHEWSKYHLPPLTAGLWQHPEEFAELLVLLRERKVRRLVEVGTFCGWSATLLAAYLGRLGECQVLSLDTRESWDYGPRVRPRGMPQLPGLVFRVLEPHYALAPLAMDADVLFIDGAHEYHNVSLDFESRADAKLVVLHDVNDRHISVAGGHDGGVPRFWQELKDREPERCREIRRRDGHPSFGYGIFENHR